MEHGFWHDRWKSNRIGFNQVEANPLLVRHIDKLYLASGQRIFLPLCGKTVEIGWLLSQDFNVVGAELSEMAIQQLFQELGVEATISPVGPLKHYRAPNVDIFVGDIFELTGSLLGNVDAVYDRAALVALPPEMRDRYTQHLIDITGKASQLLISFDYDQAQMDGPPFSVKGREIRRHYQDIFNISLLESFDMPGGLKGKCPAKEEAWLLNTDR